MTAPRDYVTQGIARWPEASRQPTAVTYFSVYLQALTNNETALLQVLDGFTSWNVPQSNTFDFILDTIGNRFLGQPRPSGFSNEEYRCVLIARTIARVSNATEGDVVRLIAYLSTLNGGAGQFVVTSGVPEHWTIAIFDAVLTPQWEAVYVQLIFDTIGATDSFELTIANNATAVYDDDQALYDVALYGP